MPKLSATGKKALDDLVTQTVKEGKLPGLALVVSNLEEEIYANAGGNLVYGDPSSPPVTPDTIFWVCSMTKLLVSIAGLQLIEQGKLDFSTHVSKYFPEFNDAIVLENLSSDKEPSFRPVKEPVTIHHLLTHTSGLDYIRVPRTTNKGRPYYQLDDAGTHEYKEGNQYDQFFEIYKGEYPGIPLIFEPGSGYTYGYGSDILGFVVEKITGQTLGEYSKQHIFEPLGIKNTYVLTPEQKESLVELCFRNPDGSISLFNDRVPTIPRHPRPVHLHLGGVGSYSTFPDYLSLLRHLLQVRAGRTVPNPLLKRETVKSLFESKLTPKQALDLDSTQFVYPGAKNLNWSTGLALNTTNWEGRRKAGSAFWAGWAGTWYFMDPTTGVALVAGSQIVPGMDAGSRIFAEKAEEIVYANLED